MTDVHVRRGAAGPAAHGDRCPHSLLFAAGFGGCATYQPVTFVTTDSLNRRLAPTTTCRHLTVGEDDARSGRFYPRCSLGAPVQRLRWLAAATPERVEVARLLQEEFESMCQPHREQLMGIKARVLASAWTPALREELDRGTRQFVEACERFLEERRERFEDAGLPVPAIAELMHDMARAWTTSSGPSARIREERVRRLPPIAQAFLGSMAAPPAGPAPSPPLAGGDAVELVGRPVFAGRSPDEATCKPGALRITTTAEPRGIALAGDVDLSNVHLVEEHLARLGDGPGDVHVDFNGVAFCDVAGLRAIFQAGERLRAASRLVLTGMPERVRAMMRLAGWGAPVGVAFAEPPPASGTDGAPDGLTS